MWRFLTRDMLGFGFGLWLFGYLLGVVLFAVVPLAQIGWWVTPFGLAATLLTLWKWVHVGSLRRGAALGLGWSAIAIAGDYLFIVKLLGPPDRYDKPDVYLHYLMTFALPIAAAAARSWRGRTAAWANPPSCCAAFAAKRATDLDNRGGLRKARARFAAREPAMDLAAFRASLRAVAPPAELAPAVAALWWDAKGDWNRAHALAQADEGGAGDWVHAYLHRKEGDAGNAGYWYRRAGKPASRASLAEEWAAIAAVLLGGEG